jgi:hypothetical protein
MDPNNLEKYLAEHPHGVMTVTFNPRFSCHGKQNQIRPYWDVEVRVEKYPGLVGVYSGRRPSGYGHSAWGLYPAYDDLMAKIKEEEEVAREHAEWEAVYGGH